jgi:WD40 repeat protein
VGSTGTQPDRLSTTENRTLVPALVILGAPPGAQIFVDDQFVASINSTGQASISSLAIGKHRLGLRLNGYLDYDQGIQVQEEQTSTVRAKLEPFELPASNAFARAPIVAGIAAIPAPVTSTRTPPPDFVLDRSFKGHSGWVTGIAFSPDGQRLASGSWDQTVKFWEVSTGEQLSTVASKMKEIQALAFSRGRTLAGH